MRNKLNLLGKKKIPFLFIIDFDVKKYSITPLNQLNINNINNINNIKNIKNDILYSIDGFSNLAPNNYFTKANPFLKKKP